MLRIELARRLFERLVWVAPEERSPAEVAEFYTLIGEIIPRSDKAASARGIAELAHLGRREPRQSGCEDPNPRSPDTQHSTSEIGMNKLRVTSKMDKLAGPDFVLIQDIESALYFVWRQQDSETARSTMSNIAASWDRDPSERGRDLKINFVDAIDRTLFRKSR
jgi:hypothetical protein